jgi:outer membrane lipoprotein-sorting protein
MMTAPSSPLFLPRVMQQVLVALALMLLPVGSRSAGWDIDELMRNLAQIQSGHSSFVEKKSIAVLDQAVESSGELFYTAPDHLEKRTLKPKPESMILDHDTLVIERGRKKHVLQLQDYPEVAAFIDSIRGTLAGDRKALEQHYRLSLDGTAEQWTLQLLPLDEKMQSVIKRIRIAGVRDAVRSIEMTQADGDSSLMLMQRLAAP